MPQDRLDPPMTKKERELVRKFRTAISMAVGAFQFYEDGGIRAMAQEELAIFDENVNRRVQAYRDGKSQ